MSFRDALAANRRAIITATTPELRAILPLLRQAEKEATRGLADTLKMAKGEKYTLQLHRSNLYQLRRSIDIIEKKLGAATAGDLSRESVKARAIAMANLRNMIAAGEKQFHDSVLPLRIDTATRIAKTGEMLWERHATSAERYAGDVGRDIRRRFAVGIVRGETTDQIVNRLVGSKKLADVLREQGVEETAKGAMGRVFGVYRGWADRLVQTELAHDYNRQHVDAIEDANRDDPGYKLEWDAANDRRTCIICRSLDGERIELTGYFHIGVRHAPAHPYCRCSVVPWRRGWN